MRASKKEVVVKSPKFVSSVTPAKSCTVNDVRSSAEDTLDAAFFMFSVAEETRFFLLLIAQRRVACRMSAFSVFPRQLTAGGHVTLSNPLEICFSYSTCSECTTPMIGMQKIYGQHSSECTKICLSHVWFSMFSASFYRHPKTNEDK